MKRILHVVPGLREEGNGIAVAVRLIAGEQGAELVDVHQVSRAQIATADEVWVHSAWTPFVWRAFLFTLSLKKGLVRMVHANLDPVRLAYHSWRKRLVGPLERMLLRMSDVVVATCPEEADWIRAYEPRVKRLDVLDMKRFFDLPKSAPETRRPTSGDGVARPLHLLYLGRRHPLKGVGFLERAVAEIVASCRNMGVERPNPPVELRIVGDAFGEEKERVWEWCDILVLPTLSENFGLVVAEALSRGKRVVTTDGAPAWKGHPGVTYLEGYRDGSNEHRVALLRAAIADYAAHDCEG